jgi:hypothetical protein
VNDCATSKMRFETPAELNLEAAFDGGRLTSDGGICWLAEVDSQLGLCETISEQMPEWRKRKGQHTLLALLKQRIYQIACGYEDQNDSNSLRTDPLLKLACGSLPESGEDLASQPTISRMENSVSTRACYQVAKALSELYVRERSKDGAPKRRSFSISTQRTIPPTVIKKRATTTATSKSTSTTRYWSSMGTRGS